ncbi:two-component system response regulator [Janibacter hoylei PVAS-1]|uniref:DNA-binding response regulator n=1 Tax=Janibacter hoylei PVAS-1 TaxID=1210046 RepID=K1E749_9MICO|nr:response regulator transcription factor [Janibacter hoylei]EKA61232.1 two-component system response regulator [Janibacter hoylei PVAS-1]RWU82824.1 DNA-binding response regulator [Janibacter hoylei PVAS-1]
MTDPTTQPTRIVLAEDSVLLRDGIVRLLTSAGFEVPAACPDAESFLAAVDEHEPDLVVDVRMPPTFTSEGIVAALAVRDKHPETAVMVLSQYVEEQYATELVASRSTGVGYLLKDRVADTSDFIAALRDVAAGGTVLDPEVVTQLLTRARHADPLAALTPREVLDLMAQGRTNSAIGKGLYISDGAVEKHVTSIFTKLDLPPADGDHRRVLAVLRWLDQED